MPETFEPGIREVRFKVTELSWGAIAGLFLLGLSFAAIIVGLYRETVENETWVAERHLARICPSGDRVYEWRGRYYTRDRTVVISPEMVC